jgi:replicative DNA helicase
MNLQEKIKRAKQEINLLDYIPGKKINVGGGKIRVNPCPVCNKKDHFTIYTGKNTYSSFNNCCNGGSIIDYIMEVEGLEKQEAIKKVLTLSNQEGSLTKMNKQIEKPISAGKSKDIDLTKNILEFYSNTNIAYFKNRGLSEEIISKYKLLVADPRKLLKDNLNLVPKLNNIFAYEYILPVWNNNKVVSIISRRNDDKSKNNDKTMNLKGIKQQMFNIELLKSGKDFLFICESIFDALSIESINNSFGSISLNSVKMANHFIEAVKSNKKQCQDKTFVLCGDNDEYGTALNNQLKNELESLGIKTNIFHIKNDYKDINEYAVKNPEAFKTSFDDFINKNTAYEFMNKFLMDEINKVKNFKVKETGFNDFDKKMNGGLHAGLYVLGAISSLGKTTFIHQVADNVSNQGQKVLFFSLEQSKFELISKTLSRELAKINPDKALTARQIMNGEYNENIQNAVNNYTYASKNLKIFEGNFDTTVNTVRNIIDKHIKENKDNPFVIVDYLQILQALDVRMSDKQKVENNVTELKRMSRDFNIPLFVISSLNRDSYLNPISYESFKETGGIEYTADNVFGLQYSKINTINAEKTKIKQRELLKKESLIIPREIDLVCLKQRNGIQNFSCKFKFYPQFNFFMEE